MLPFCLKAVHGLQNYMGPGVYRNMLEFFIIIFINYFCFFTCGIWCGLFKCARWSAHEEFKILFFAFSAIFIYIHYVIFFKSKTKAVPSGFSYISLALGP